MMRSRWVKLNSAPGAGAERGALEASRTSGWYEGGGWLTWTGRRSRGGIARGPEKAAVAGAGGGGRRTGVGGWARMTGGGLWLGPGMLMAARLA